MDNENSYIIYWAKWANRPYRRKASRLSKWTIATMILVSLYFMARSAHAETGITPGVVKLDVERVLELYFGGQLEADSDMAANKHRLEQLVLDAPIDGPPKTIILKTGMPRKCFQNGLEIPCKFYKRIPLKNAKRIQTLLNELKELGVEL